MPRRHPIYVIGRGDFCSCYDKKIDITLCYVLVGKPLPVTQILEPSEVEIDSLHLQYLDALTELFDVHKDKYGYSGTTLEFI